MTALLRQVGGTHYAKLRMQPFEFSLANGWDGAAHSILKYVTRHRDKGGEDDLAKALHIVEIRRELLGPWLMPTRDPRARIAMRDYVAANGIGGTDAAVLLSLEAWVNNPAGEDRVLFLLRGLRRMIEGYAARSG